MKILLIILVLAVILGAGYQTVANSIDARRHPEDGAPIFVNGKQFQLNCSGQGSHTVILESGFSDFLSSWRHLQPEIEKFARVCSYDRAGYGGSDPGPVPRTSDRIVDELHALLSAAEEKPPYILVGHSFGGYNVRVFRGKYPDEVAGMVLVDSIQEDQYTLLPDSWKEFSARSVERYRSQARWAPIRVELGILRLELLLRGIPASYLLLQTKYLKARASEVENIQVSAEQARAAGSFGDMPLIVLTAGRTSDAAVASAIGEADARTFFQTWIGILQPRLAALSTRGEQIIVPDSGHDMPTDNPTAIVDAVRRIVAGSG